MRIAAFCFTSEVHAPEGGPVAKMAAMAPVSASETRFDDVYDVYDAYRPLLRKIAMGKFHVPRADVDTLVHDVFTTYLAHQDRVRELHPYLVGGICNAARDYWRRTERERAVFCDAEVCPATPDDALLDSVVQTLLVRSALGVLGPSCRDALHRFLRRGRDGVGSTTVTFRLGAGRPPIEKRGKPTERTCTQEGRALHPRA
jgi:hypothetical protein